MATRRRPSIGFQPPVPNEDDPACRPHSRRAGEGLRGADDGQEYAQELSDEAYGIYNFNWGYYLNKTAKAGGPQFPQ